MSAHDRHAGLPRTNLQDGARRAEITSPCIALGLQEASTMEQVPALLSLILASLVVMGSPGPSTMSVTAVGAAFGFRRSLRLCDRASFSGRPRSSSPWRRGRRHAGCRCRGSPGAVGRVGRLHRLSGISGSRRRRHCQRQDPAASAPSFAGGVAARPRPTRRPIWRSPPCSPARRSPAAAPRRGDAEDGRS